MAKTLIWIDGNTSLSDSFLVTPFFSLLENINDSAFALDVVLLKDDEKKLNQMSDDCIPILSMELYHYITTTLKAKCVLYSKYTYLHRLQENWKALYKARYNIEVEMFPRDGLYLGSIDPVIINALKEATE